MHRHSKPAPHPHPDEAVANALEALRERAKQLDTSDRETYRTVNRLAKDYRAWFTGEWKTTAERAESVLAKHMSESVACANRHGFHEIAREVMAIQEKAGTSRPRPGKSA